MVRLITLHNTPAFHIASNFIHILLATFHICTSAVVSDEAGSTKEAKACTKEAVVLFLEGFGY